MRDKIKRSIPNIITLSRILSLIMGFVLFIKEREEISICLYIYGSVSDAFDGYFARKWNAYTKLGGYLDAISDKFYALSIIIISILHNNYLIIPIAILELIISIINYSVLKRNGITKTARVGKFKMTLEFILLITALLLIKIKSLYYLFIALLILTIYFQIQCINAYINEKNNKKYGMEVEYKGKNNKEKTKLLIDEFIYYLTHPVKVVK